MADQRSIFRVAIPQDATALHQSIVQLLSSKGYEQTTYTKNNGPEIVWKWGDGFFTSLRYIKLDYQPQELIISAWFAANSGILLQTETSLEGKLGIIPKRGTKKVVDEIIRLAQASTSAAPQQ